MSKFHLFETRLPYAKVPLGTYETFEDAFLAVEALNCIHGDPDEQHPGCWDGFLADGRIVCIEPVGFVLA